MSTLGSGDSTRPRPIYPESGMWQINLPDAPSVDPRMSGFLLELLMKPEERALWRALVANPRDGLARGAYVDYLLEQGRDASAALVRNGFVPG